MAPSLCPGLICCGLSGRCSTTCWIPACAGMTSLRNWRAIKTTNRRRSQGFVSGLLCLCRTVFYDRGINSLRAGRRSGTAGLSTRIGWAAGLNGDSSANRARDAANFCFGDHSWCAGGLCHHLGLTDLAAGRVRNATGTGFLSHRAGGVRNSLGDRFRSPRAGRVRDSLGDRFAGP